MATGIYMDKKQMARVITARNIIGTIIDDDVEHVYQMRMLSEAWQNLDAILKEDVE